MNESKFKKGLYAKVILPDCDFSGKQCRVEEVVFDDGNKDGPIGVVFPRYYKYLFEHRQNPDTIIRFQENELELLTRESKQDIDNEALCNFLFGNMWHTSCQLPFPLMIGFTTCMHEKCSNFAVFRILVNSHGTVAEYDVCKDHVEWHGRCTDMFPFGD